MPYENIWGERDVYRKYNGCVTGKEIINATEEVERDERFDSIRYIINDFLDVTEQVVTSHEIKIIAAIDKAASLSNPNIKIAIVATRKVIQYLAILYCDLTEDSPYQTRVFTNIEEAREWIL